MVGRPSPAALDDNYQKRKKSQNIEAISAADMYDAVHRKDSFSSCRAATNASMPNHAKLQYHYRNL